MTRAVLGRFAETTRCVDHQFLEIMATISKRADEAEAANGGLAEEFQLLQDAGLLRACLPSIQGGSDLGLTAAASERTFEILRGLGRANLSAGRLFEGHVNAVKLVQLYGSPDMRERVGKVVSEGALLGVWGADGDRPLRLLRNGDAIRLDGEKIFASGLGLVRFAVISLREQSAERQATQLALVDVTEARRQDASCWRASGMRATQSGAYDFTGLKIDDAQFLGLPGDFEREPYFEGGVWRYSAVHLGGAEALVDHWRVVLGKRGHLEDPLQITRFARATGLCRAMASLLRETACIAEAATPRDAAVVDGAVAAALLARQFTEDACVEILALAEKSLGTSAHMPGPVERIRRDLSLFLRQAAPDAKLMKAGRLITSRPDTFEW